MVSYPVGDLIIRIKNGYQARREHITSSYSKYRGEVLKKLKELKYIKDYHVEGDKIKNVTIDLKYDEAGAPALTGVKIYSTPGRRWYSQASELKPILGGLGCSLISTPQGILDNKQARKKKLGGELLFAIW
ncbi:MAG: ribosomal protein [Candidatus Parcubacteria bacterium]|jgi:small subunit ribosomal protein S8